MTQIFTADPSAKVFEDRVYVYTSHDADGQTGYDMKDYHAFSSSDLVNWQDHGVVLDVADVPWASTFYAPDTCYSAATGKYYLYFPNGASNIGVAVADAPGGPFVDALGEPLITGSTPGVSGVEWIFDPGCFVDDDGEAYLYFGGGEGTNPRVIRLGADMISLNGSAQTIETPNFFEASFMHKRGTKYYYSYSSDFADGAARLDYMMSDDPMTGFEFVGTMLPSPDQNNGNNNHGSVIEYRDKWYIFYHNRVLETKLGLENDYQRSITLDNLTYADDGTIVEVSSTQGIVAQLECLDGLTRVEAEALAAENGIETDFAQDDDAHSGVMITAIQDGDWTGYSQVDFGAGATQFIAHVAAAAEGGSIEVRIDGCDTFTSEEGTAVGTCAIPSTGGAYTWSDVTCTITQVSGAHDLCLRFTGEGQTLFNLDHFHFE